MRSIQRNGAPMGVLDRAVQILGAFGPGDDTVGLAELARRSGLPKTTAHRLCEALSGHGLLERTGGGYRVGLRMFELGQLVPLRQGLRESARPVLADLQAASGATVHLATLDGAEVVYLEILGRTTATGGALPSRVGGRFPAHATAVGKAMLAYSSPALVAAVLAGGLERRTRHTIVMPGQFTRELTDTAARGIAVEHEESALGVTCVAAPVFDSTARPVAAISISQRAAGSGIERYAPAVRTAALTLTRQLGGALPR